MIVPTVTAIRPVSDHDYKVARLPDLRYILDLAGRHRSELGFLPRAAFLEYLERRRIWVTLENDEPAGYILWRPPALIRPQTPHTILRIVHACIQFDARRHLHATRLVRELESQLPSASPTYVACWCADDLDANTFWHAIGFRHYATRTLRTHTRVQRVHRGWIREV